MQQQLLCALTANSLLPPSGLPRAAVTQQSSKPHSAQPRTHQSRTPCRDSYGNAA